MCHSSISLYCPDSFCKTYSIALPFYLKGIPSMSQPQWFLTQKGFCLISELTKKDQLWIGRTYWWKRHLFLIIYYVRLRMWKLRNKVCASRNVESTKGQIKNISKAVRPYKWHRQETNYHGDAKKWVVTWIRGIGNGFSERLIFEMNFQGWIEFYVGRSDK